jgi:hypothetical protein
MVRSTIADAGPDPPSQPPALQRYPRVRMPRRIDESSKAWMLGRWVHDMLIND